MSSKFTGLLWDLDLPHEQLLVLLAMADHADHLGNNIYPSPELIAWKTQYSERHVRRIVKQLLTDNILVKKGYGPHGVIRYSIDLTKGKPKLPFRPADNNSAPSPDKMSEGGQNVIAQDKTSEDKMSEGMTSSAPSPDKMSPKLSTEPKTRDTPPLSPSRKWTRFPADWRASPEMLANFQSRFPMLDISVEEENLRDWEFKDPKSDPAATWRRWMREAAKRQQQFQSKRGYVDRFVE